MRRFLAAAFPLACLALAGCSTSSALDGVTARPSAETTASVARPQAAVQPVAVPVVPVSAVAPATPGVTSLVEEQEAAVALAEDDALDTKAVQAVAAVVVPRPVAAGKVAPLKVVRHRFSDAKPINFGKTQPKHYPVHGVDVSRWQGNIDWVTLRSQGANFAYIKATDGGDHLDPMFHKNWRAAHEAGLKRGAYHFFYWCRDGASQAKWFIRNVPKVAGAMPPVIDVEWNHLSGCKKRPSREVVLKKMTVFMDMLEAHYGQRPVIYTAPDFYKDNLRGAFPNHPFWLRAVAQHPSKVYPGRDWVFWQYSGSGLSQGVNGKIDLNVFYGSEKQWSRWVSGQSLVASD